MGGAQRLGERTNERTKFVIKGGGGKGGGEGERGVARLPVCQYLKFALMSCTHENWLTCMCRVS